LTTGIPEDQPPEFTGLVIPADPTWPCYLQRLERGVFGFKAVQELVRSELVGEVAYDLDAHLYVSDDPFEPVNPRVTEYIRRHSLLAGPDPDPAHSIRGDAVLAGSRGPVPLGEGFAANACDPPERFYELFDPEPQPRW